MNCAISTSILRKTSTTTRKANACSEKIEKITPQNRIDTHGVPYLGCTLTRKRGIMPSSAMAKGTRVPPNPLPINNPIIERMAASETDIPRKLASGLFGSPVALVPIACAISGNSQPTEAIGSTPHSCNCASVTP